MKDFLSEFERTDLRLKHRKERDRRIADRIKAVLLVDKGWTYRAVAEALMVDEETVSQHVQDYQERQKLKPENGGSQSKLNERQTQVSTPDDEPIVFMDSAHPAMATKVSYGWIRTGKNKPIACSASRTRVNLTGALNLQTMDIISHDYETINGDSAIDFLKRLKAAYPKAPFIHVILDQSGYHAKKEVQAFAKKARIKLHFLPPYSPNLNPIERVWKVMNEEVRNNRFFPSPGEFKRAILDFFNAAWPLIAPFKVDRINDNFQLIKAVSST